MTLKVKLYTADSDNNNLVMFLVLYKNCIQNASHHHNWSDTGIHVNLKNKITEQFTEWKDNHTEPCQQGKKKKKNEDKEKPFKKT